MYYKNRNNCLWLPGAQYNVIPSIFYNYIQNSCKKKNRRQVRWKSKGTSQVKLSYKMHSMEHNTEYSYAKKQFLKNILPKSSRVFFLFEKQLLKAYRIVTVHTHKTTINITNYWLKQKLLYFLLHILFPCQNFLLSILAHPTHTPAVHFSPTFALNLFFHFSITSCPFILITLLPFFFCFHFSFCAGAASCSTTLWLAKPSFTFSHAIFHRLPSAFPSSVHLFTCPSPCRSLAVLRCKKQKGEAYETGDSQGCFGADAQPGTATAPAAGLPLPPQPASAGSVA